eukprot:3622628-Rhodomonas_salina.1
MPCKLRADARLYDTAGHAHGHAGPPHGHAQVCARSSALCGTGLADGAAAGGTDIAYGAWGTDIAYGLAQHHGGGGAPRQGNVPQGQ